MEVVGVLIFLFIGYYLIEWIPIVLGAGLLLASYDLIFVESAVGVGLFCVLLGVILLVYGIRAEFNKGAAKTQNANKIEASSSEPINTSSLPTGIVTDLEKLGTMRNTGLLTPEEFEAAKQKILSKNVG